MVTLFQKLLKVVNALAKILPSIIEVLHDFIDDGKLNSSPKRGDK